MDTSIFLRRRWLWGLCIWALLVLSLPQRAQAASPADAVNSLDDVQQAVVRIESVGTFLDPNEAQPVAAWGGSGFIISPDGVAVTNNHVVAGSAYLKVYVAGEKTPRSARVLGVSECSDLAVIQIDGDNFPYLDWFDQPLKVGLDVYTAGFPFRDPEFTLTKGIIAKAKANGNTSWASVDHVLQHDASINPGNSGGPLIDPNGRVIGINYAGNSKNNQYFAIAGDIAQPIIEQLRAHKNLLSIGLNGQALTDGKSFSGVWVASVTSGSLADKAGLQPGDFILEMENLPLATDGTLKTYCDILRSHTPDDTLNIKIVRGKQELEGQLNGRPLPSAIAKENTTATPAPAIPTYHYELVDDVAISGQFPEEWADRKSDDWLDKNKKVIGKVFAAAPDVNKFSTSWRAPGVFVHSATGIQEEINIKQWLDVNDVSKNCTYVKRVQHKHSAHGHTYTGAFDIWDNCDNSGSVYAYLVAVSEPRGQLVTIGFISTNKADSEAWGNLVQSFYVNENEPTPTPTEPPTDTPEPTATSTPPAPATPAPATPAPISASDIVARLAQIKQTTPIFQDDLHADNAKIDASTSVTVSRSFSEKGFQMVLNQPQWNGWNLAYISMADFLVETTVTFVDGPSDFEGGLNFRYTSNQNYYTFAISPKGYYKLTKTIDDHTEELISWTKSDSIAAGIGAMNQLAVLAEDDHFILLINDQVVAQMNDDSLKSGRVALFAGTFDEANAQVAFEQLTIWQVGKTATAEEPALLSLTRDAISPWVENIKATQPLFHNPLRTNDGQMDATSDKDTDRTYSPEGLSVRVKNPKIVDWSLAHITVADFLLETQTTVDTIPQSSDYGVIFRYVDNDNFYLFTISPYGNFSVSKIVDKQWSTLVTWTDSSAIKTEAGAVNRLAVLAKGAHMILIINDEIVAHLTDDSLSSGRVGLAVETYEEGNAKVTFDHLNIWKVTTGPDGKAESKQAAAQTEPPTATPTAALPSSSNSILVEDFHEDKLNPAIWMTQSKGTGVQLAIARQRLEITHSADAADDPAQGIFSAHVTSVCALTGDFDLQVDYTLLAWPPDNGVRLGLLVKPDPQHGLAVERFNKMDNSETDGYVVDFNGVAGYTPTADSKGKLRLTRANTTLTGYFYRDGNWVTLSSNTIATTDLQFGLGSWSHNRYFGKENVRIAFDNFIIQSGALACPQADSQTTTDNQATPQPTETPTPTVQAPVAVVKVRDLIVRGGPGANYPLVVHARQGDQLPVIGQVKNCAWLKVNLPVSKEAWVIGGAEYVDFQADCGRIAEVKPPPTPVYRPIPNKQGCLLFQNNLNAELTITFTSKDGKWNKTFKVGRKGSHQECFAPGAYTYTLDAPPPWESSNGKIEIAPGSYKRFPINAGG